MSPASTEPSVLASVAPAPPYTAMLAGVNCDLQHSIFHVSAQIVCGIVQEYDYSSLSAATIPPSNFSTSLILAL
jgi:hypothetical protein